MRMEIKVNPKRHHNHIQNTNPQTTTTTTRYSPKFVVTKPETTTEKASINHAGIIKGFFFSLCIK